MRVAYELTSPQALTHSFIHSFASDEHVLLSPTNIFNLYFKAARPRRMSEGIYILLMSYFWHPED